MSGPGATETARAGQEASPVSQPPAGAAVPAREPQQASVVGMAFALTSASAAFLAHGRLVNGDGDLLRHILIGRYILGHGPRFADPFSFSRAGEPFLAYEWLSQVAYAGAHAAAGFAGVVALAALLIGGAVALVVAYVRRDGGDPWLALVTGAAAVVLNQSHWIARPHLFSYLALAALPHALLSRRRLLWTSLLFAFWANLHPGFLYGAVMVGAWGAGEWIDEIRAGRPRLSALRTSAAPFVVALAASLLNPFGWALHVHAMTWMGSQTVAQVNEFQALIAFSPEGLPFMAVCGLLVLGLAAQKEWPGWRPLLVTAAAFMGALSARRNTAMFALFALPVMARALTPLVRQLHAGLVGRMREEFARSDTRGWRLGLGVGTLLVALLLTDGRTQRITIVPDQPSPDVFPAAAVRYAREARLGGRLFSQYSWGGYVLYAWPGQRLFVDSMADFFGDDLVKEYGTIVSAERGWKELMDHYGFSLVLVRPDAPLVEALKETPQWRVAHEDSVAVLLVRAGT